MNTAREALHHIETGSVAGLVSFLGGLGDEDRRWIAWCLPADLSERRRGGWEAERWVRERAHLYRLAGAACMRGAAQVASWLNRRELGPVEAEADAARVLSVLANRPLEWRRDLAVRLVRRLRPATGPMWRRPRALGNWDLAAALVVETGAEPPENDAFVSGWVQRMAERQQLNGGARLPDDGLLDHMLPRLFQAEGVAEGLYRNWNRGWGPHRSLVEKLAVLSLTGRVQRRALLDGCMSRFLVGVGAADAAPFILLWRELKPETAEIPVADLVRVLPSASSPVLQLAVEELRRAESAGLLDVELFAEAVEALAYRPEKKHMAAAVRWIAAASPARGGAAVAALAPVFDVDTPSLRERAVRVAVELAPHTSEPDREAIREAGARLPADLRRRLAAAYGAVDEAPSEPVVVPALTATPLPPLAPPIASVPELAAELDQPLWPLDSARFDRILAALVELSHQDRDAVVAGLQPWWRTNWRHPFDASIYAYGVSGFDEEIGLLLSRCALAVVLPADSRALTKELTAESRWRSHEPALQRFVQQRYREVISLFERGETIPVLLATPTSPTGHVDAATLVTRMERLDGAEPLAYDFLQALLRLPRRPDPEPATRAEDPELVAQAEDPELVARAGRLPSEAGRRLAACLRDGGLPEPVVTWEFGAFDRPSYVKSLQEAHARLAPPEGVPAPLAELWTLAPKTGYRDSSRYTAWWPSVMPSHREAVAAHLLECGPASLDAAAVAVLAHNDGPVGLATASTLVAAMNYSHPTQRALVADAFLTLAARGELPAADLGRALGHMVRGEQVKLHGIISVLDELTAAGAHAEVWTALAQALPLLLPQPGEKPIPGLGKLLTVATRAAALTGAQDDVPGLPELASRKGSSLLIHEARRLHKALSSQATTPPPAPEALAPENGR